MLSSLPIFPAFKPIDIHDRILFTRFLANFEPYSDFNFTSIFCWQGVDVSEIAQLNGNLVIRMPDYIDNHKIYSFIGTSEVDETLLEILAHTKKIDLLPEVVVQNIRDKDNFIIHESIDNFDYIFDLKELSHLEGSKFKKHRNKAKKFEYDHSNHQLETIVTTAISERHANIIKEIDNEWSRQFSREDGDIRTEKHALENILENSEHFNLFVVEVRVNNEMKAFSINELLGNKYAICHFEKALISHHNYIGTYLVHAVARELLKHGSRLVNWEQDLGLEGLRKSKSSYHPYKMLKKYTVQSSAMLSGQTI